ncbi:MAG TPA: hypothetical protein VMU51_11265 [Mycobacteriales bacterium]|nr:hypothetical protein [Mycobacteriales bacterium]
MGCHPLLRADQTHQGGEPSTSSAWLAVAYQVARETGSAVIGAAQPPTPGRNHYRLHLRPADGPPIRLLLHAPARLVAAADDTDPDTLTAPFIPVPRPDLFRLAGLRTADPAELEQPLTEDLVRTWFTADRRDIEYHRPPRVGDVIFNWFD